MNNEVLWLRLDGETLSEIESFSEKLMKENNVKFEGYHTSKKPFMLSYFVEETIKSLVDNIKTNKTFTLTPVIKTRLQKRVKLSDESVLYFQELREMFKFHGIKPTNSIIIDIAILYYSKLLKKENTNIDIEMLTATKQENKVGKTNITNNLDCDNFLFVRLKEETYLEIEKLFDTFVQYNNITFINFSFSKKSFMLSYLGYFIDSALKSLFQYIKKNKKLPLEKKIRKKKFQKRVELSDEGSLYLQELREVFKFHGIATTDATIIDTIISYYSELSNKK